MSDYLKFKSDKPTLKELAIFCGRKGESGARHLRDNNREEYIKEYKEFMKAKMPFLSVEDYIFVYFPDVYKGDKIEWIEEDIKKEKDLDKKTALEKELSDKKYSISEKIIEIERAVEENKMIGTFYTDSSQERKLFLPTNGKALSELFEGLDDVNSSKEARVISVGNFKGGVAKTTTIVNLSSTLAYCGKKVLVLDLDSQGSCTMAFGYSGDDFKHTLIKLITMIEDDDYENILKDSIIKTDIDKNFENGCKGKIDIIGNCATSIELLEDLPSYSRELGTMERAIARLLSHVKNDYDYILIDLPPRLDLVLRMAIVASNYFIFALVSEAHADEGITPVIKTVAKTANSFKFDMNKGFEILGGVNNKFEANTNAFAIAKANSQNLLKSLLGEDRGFFRTDINKNKIYNESAMVGVGSPLFLEPCDRAIKSYFNLTEDILERILEVEITKSMQE